MVYSLGVNVDGLLLINKPKGITSFDVIRQLRRSTGVRKIGHAGTLDPLATGLMLMLFGTACKSAGSFSKLDKTYLAEITLGATSTTGDAEGEIVAHSASSDQCPTMDEVCATLDGFTGAIVQTPSVYSAIKIDGQEAYKRARRGEKVEMPSRQVNVYSSHVTNYAYPVLTIEVSVSSGTYIRSLAEDIGSELGTGAYLSGLVRTRVGKYLLTEAHELGDVVADLLAEKLIQI